jgi:hypothetical protein
LDRKKLVEKKCDDVVCLFMGIQKGTGHNGEPVLLSAGLTDFSGRTYYFEQYAAPFSINCSLIDDRIVDSLKFNKLTQSTHEFSYEECGSIVDMGKSLCNWLSKYSDKKVRIYCDIQGGDREIFNQAIATVDSTEKSWLPLLYPMDIKTYVRIWKENIYTLSELCDYAGMNKEKYSRFHALSLAQIYRTCHKRIDRYFLGGKEEEEAVKREEKKDTSSSRLHPSNRERIFETISDGEELVIVGMGEPKTINTTFQDATDYARQSMRVFIDKDDSSKVTKYFIITGSPRKIYAVDSEDEVLKTLNANNITDSFVSLGFIPTDLHGFDLDKYTEAGVIIKGEIFVAKTKKTFCGLEGVKK